MSTLDHAAIVRRRREESRAVMASFSPELDGRIADAARITSASVGAGGRVYAFGNGGSASDALHFVGELVGRYRRERAPLPAIALGFDPCSLTAVGNDYGFEHVFERQVRGLVRAGDAVFAISTSGRSPNVLRASRAARELGARVIGLTGEDGADLAPLCDVAICVPSRETPRIQEAHILVLHVIAELVEAAAT